MKIRVGFVSNSSGSSFICEICAASEFIYDGIPEDVGFVRCENEHTICEEHLLDYPDYDEARTETEEGNRYLALYCPICQFQEYSQPELVRYLKEEYNIEKDVVFQEVKKVNKRRKKLYDSEYIEYVLKQFNLTDDLVLTDLKIKFGTYENFLNRKKII